MAQRLKLAVVGDVHGCWTQEDVLVFDQSDYSAVIFVGDITGLRFRTGLRIATRIAALSLPALVMPGNHDAVTVGQFSAELLGLPPLVPFGARRMRHRVEKLRRALGPAQLCGYSLHQVGNGDRTIGVVAARPHAMGGRLSFAPYLRARFGIATLEQSTERLCQLVDESPERDLVFLAHNGPHGLGDAPTDPWGVDFKSGGGDFGDPDLSRAIAHAQASGRNVIAVVAGHMHRPNRHRDERRWHVERDGVQYVNAARTPRAKRVDGRALHHHVALELDGPRCTVTEHWASLAKDVS